MRDTVVWATPSRNFLNPHKNMNPDEIKKPLDSDTPETEHPSTPAEQPVAHEPETPAIPPTGGESWSQGRTSKDNRHSPRFGICVGQDMDARRIPSLSRGDMVTIEIVHW
jgi:hypothetical protein